MSGRNGAENREHQQRVVRAERIIDRDRELHIINAIRDQARDRARERLERALNNQNFDHINRLQQRLIRLRDPLSPENANMNNNNNNNNNNRIPASSGATKRKCPSYGPEDVESWASTEIEQETFSFLWTIKNFSSFTTNEEIKSPSFKGGLQSNHNWQIKINPMKKIDDTDYFACHLILIGFGDGDSTLGRRLKVRFQISLLDQEGRPGKQAGSQSMTVCEFKKNSVWGYDKFMTSSDLISPTRRLVEEDSLKIHCRIWIEGDIKHTVGNGGALKEQISDDEMKSRRLNLLSTQFQTAFVNGTFADVAVSTPNKTFMAHKIVLASRSPVFQRMFSANMIESSANTVEINDFEEDVVQGMLEYMYTGQSECLNEKAPDLMQIAEKYDLAGMKEDCEHTIANNLTIENAAEVLVLAHLHNATLLKPKVVDFINRNRDAVKKTKTFQVVAQANAAVFVDLYLSQ